MSGEFSGRFPLEQGMAGTEGERKQERKGHRQLTRFKRHRAFADFVLGSLILHFFCVNFIN